MTDRTLIEELAVSFSLTGCQQCGKAAARITQLETALHEIIDDCDGASEDEGMYPPAVEQVRQRAETAITEEQP